MSSLAPSRPPAPTVSTTDYLGITASQFRSFATPAISVPFPGVYAQSQYAFAFPNTPTYAATRALSQIGGIPATSGISTALYAAGTKYGQTQNGSGGGGSGWPVWATAVIAACGGAALIIVVTCLWCFCRRSSKRRGRQQQRRSQHHSRGQYTEKIALDQRLRANQSKEYRKTRGSYFGVNGPSKPNSNKLAAPPMGADGRSASAGRRSRNVPGPIMVDQRGLPQRDGRHGELDSAYGGMDEKAPLATPRRDRFREASGGSDVPLAYGDSPTVWASDTSPSHYSPGKAPWLMNNGGDSSSTLGEVRSGSPRSLPAWVKPDRDSFDRPHAVGRRKSFSAPTSPLMTQEGFRDSPRQSLDEPRPERQSLDSPRRPPRRHRDDRDFHAT